MVDEAHVSAATTVLLPPHPEKGSDVARGNEPKPDDR